MICDGGNVSYDAPYARDNEKLHLYSGCPARAACSPLKLFETIHGQSDGTGRFLQSNRYNHKGKSCDVFASMRSIAA